jgi:hypothetical protein
VKSSNRLPGLSITEQGAGVFDLDKFMTLVREKAISILDNTKPTPLKNIALYPDRIDIR